MALAKKTSRGRILSAHEAYRAYGVSALREVADRGSAILVSSVSEPAETLKSRRDSLGLTIKSISKATKLAASAIEDCENSKTRSPIRNIERLAIALGLDERVISFSKGAGGDVKLAARLKQLGGGASFSAATVLKMSEAAWVIDTQNRLYDLLSLKGEVINNFKPNENYGNPAWQQGYSLASETRRILGLSQKEPIASMRDVCSSLNIPLLQAELPRNFAGATVTNGSSRGILINTAGFNSNVWVRRATIAHELGHVLWDSEQNIENIRVDEYDDISAEHKPRLDSIESRANAFAVALLAPPDAVCGRYGKGKFDINGEIVRDMMEFFGISYSVATQHLKNVLKLSRDFEQKVDTEATDEWRGRESYTDDFFPISETSSLRRGEFSGLVARARKKGFISFDTASEYLMASQDVYCEKEDIIDSLYVFGAVPNKL